MYVCFDVVCGDNVLPGLLEGVGGRQCTAWFTGGKSNKSNNMFEQLKTVLSSFSRVEEVEKYIQLYSGSIIHATIQNQFL